MLMKMTTIANDVTQPMHGPAIVSSPMEANNFLTEAVVFAYTTQLHDRKTVQFEALNGTSSASLLGSSTAIMYTTHTINPLSSKPLMPIQ